MEAWWQPHPSSNTFCGIAAPELMSDPCGCCIAPAHAAACLSCECGCMQPSTIDNQISEALLTESVHDIQARSACEGVPSVVIGLSDLDKAVGHDGTSNCEEGEASWTS